MGKRTLIRMYINQLVAMAFVYSLCHSWILIAFQPWISWHHDGYLLYGLQLYLWFHICSYLQDEWW
jgi:hypothetical protein